MYYGPPTVTGITLPVATTTLVTHTTVVTQTVVQTYVIGSRPVTWPGAIPFYDPFVWWCVQRKGVSDGMRERAGTPASRPRCRASC